MTGAEIIATVSLVITLAGTAAVIIRDIRKGRVEAQAVDVAAREAEASGSVAEADVEDRIAERRLKELNRLYDKVTRLEEAFEAFKRASSMKDRAFANVLRDAAEQWPKDAPGPVFAAEDIAVLEDTMPHQWRRRMRPK